MRDPDAIVSTSTLAGMLVEPNVRVYDCTSYNNPPPPGVDEPYIPEPGEAHIPGADFLDLKGEFSDKSQRHWFMMPKDLGQLQAAFSRHRWHPRRAVQHRHNDVVDPILVDVALSRLRCNCSGRRLRQMESRGAAD